jgi:RimJ/RimL family protein N-acetyltransferase
MSIDLSKYPKVFTLVDGRSVTVRSNEPSTDEPKLIRFMQSLPDNERIYFRDDVTDPEVIHKWVHESDLSRTIPLLAEDDNNDIVANWTLHVREHGWTRQNAFIRGIIAPEWRKQGLATYIINELLKIAGELDIERVVIELVRPQEDLLKRYVEIGFEVDATLNNWVKDFRGRYHDLIIISMKLEPAWKKMELLLLEYDTHGR